MNLRMIETYNQPCLIIKISEVKEGSQYDASVSDLNNWVPFTETRKRRDLEPHKFNSAYVQWCACRQIHVMISISSLDIQP